MAVEQKRVTTVTILEGTDSFPRAIFEAEDGTPLVQADITSIAREIFDLDSTTPDVSVDSSAPVVATVIFDTLQTPSSWIEDTTGYNFKDTIAASIVAEGGHRYRAEYVFTLATGHLRSKVFEITVENMRSN